MAVKPSTAHMLRQGMWGIFSICASLGMTWHAHAQDNANVKIEAYGDPFGQSQLAPKKQARVYAYRETAA